MPEAPNTSFIPKQSPVRRQQQVGSRQVHLFSLFSYGAFFIALALTAGSFFFERHTEKQLGAKVEELNQAIGGFNEADMNQVREFNARLVQTRDRLESGVSVAAIFEALEDATVQSVSFDSLTLTRPDDAGVVVEAQMMTNSFDSSLFQRGVLERSPVVESVLVEDLSLEQATETTAGGVSFVAKINIPASVVPNTPAGTTYSTPPAPVFSDDIVDQASTTETVPEEANEEVGTEAEVLDEAEDTSNQASI